MLPVRFFMAASSLAVAGVAIWASGCGTFYDDCINGRCTPFKPAVTIKCPGDPTKDSKLVINEVDPVLKRIVFTVTVNRNCGFRSFAPGIPQH